MGEQNGHHVDLIDTSFMGIFIIPCTEGHFHTQINIRRGSVLQQKFDTLEDALNHLIALNENSVDFSALFTEPE